MIEISVMLTAVGVLLVALAVHKGQLHAWPVKSRPITLLQAVIAVVVIGAANAQLVEALVVRPCILSGDLRSHAMIAREIALGNASGGWIDVFHGGFPLGPHYPSIGWLSAAALMRVGVPPAAAAMGVTAGSVLTLNGLVFWLSMRAGASFGGALAGAALLSWMAPLTSFLGGMGSALTLGMMSQTVVMPFVVLYAYAVLFGRDERLLVLSAVMAVLAHPQVAVGASALVATVALVRAGCAPRRWLAASVAQGMVGAAVFGPGLRTLTVPFGWPPMDPWRVRGHPAGILLGWLTDGSLLDFARAPVVTTVAACSMVVLLATVRRRASFAALLALVTAVALACSGNLLASAGRFGELAISFVQPLRAYALVPVAAAACLTVAIGVVESHARGLAGRGVVWWRWRERLATLAPSAVAVVAMGLVGVPHAMADHRERTALLAQPRCGGAARSALQEKNVLRLVGEARAGRLVYSAADFNLCSATTNLDFAASLPIGSPFAAGAHVGVLTDAFGHLDATTPDAAELADILGVGTILHLDAKRPTPAEGWRERGRAGDVVLSERTAGSSYFSLGCITESWLGNDVALHASVVEAQNAATRLPWSAHAFVALNPTTQAVTIRERARSNCDPSRGTLVASERIAAGSYRASVEVPQRMDLVLKETAFHTWRFELDGRPEPFRLVAPGFMAISIPPGTHHVVARATFPVGYSVGISVALVVAAIATYWVRRNRWLRDGSFTK